MAMSSSDYTDWGVGPAPRRAGSPPPSLHVEAARGNLAAARALLARCRGAEERRQLLETTDEFGDTPVIKACRRGHAELAAHLLEQGAEVDARNEDGYTGLMLACYWEQLGVIEVLLRYGADARASSKNGRTCFDTARSAQVRVMLSSRGGGRSAPAAGSDHKENFPSSNANAPTAPSSVMPPDHSFGFSKLQVARGRLSPSRPPRAGAGEPAQPVRRRRCLVVARCPRRASVVF
jgi:hypothetical protein